MKIWIRGEGAITLRQRDFVGQGGQGAIYARGATAYKIYTNPNTMIPLGKIQELAAITDPQVIKPHKILCDSRDTPIGYTMQYVANTYTLCQLFPRAFRERNHLTPDTMLALVRGLVRGIQHVHQAGVLIVDLNEMNFLVNEHLGQLFFIDVDSYQTRCYRATALMDSVRDRHALPNCFDELTDWFSFAIISFQMFVGLHPYKGKHPFVKGLEARMQANLSVLNPDVSVPQAVYPVEVIPAAYRAWYEALFERGERCPPPTDVTGAMVVVPVVRTVTGGNTLELIELGRFAGTVIGIWAKEQHLVVATDQGLWLDGRQVGEKGIRVSGVGFSPRLCKAVAVQSGRPIPQLSNLSDRTTVPFCLSAQSIAAHDGRIYFKARDKIMELVLTDAGQQVIASSQVTAQVMEHATRLFAGVAIQDLLGSPYISIFPRSGVAYQHPIPELTPYTIVAATFMSGVLMVIGGKHGQYDRLVFRFDAEQRHYDVQVIEDVTLMDLNFVVLDTGVCVCLNEEERLEIFSNRPGSAAVKSIEDPVLGGDMRLAKHGGQLLASRGSVVYRLRMK